MDPANPRTLEQIISQLAPAYDPQVQSIQSQQAALPAYQQAQAAGLSASKDNAFSDILGGARERGIGFSGIPLAEQAKYTASTYLPAVSAMEQQFSDRNFSLADAINGLNQDKYKTANSIYTTEQGNYQQYLAQQQAAAAARAGYNLGNGNQGNGGPPPPTATGAPAPVMAKKSDGGYAFTDSAGQPISAAVYYAQATNGQGNNFRGFLQELATNGDKGAAQALGFVGNDYGYDKSKVNSQALADLYNSLIWGAQYNGHDVPQATYKAPQPSTAQNIKSGLTMGLQPFSLYK